MTDPTTFDTGKRRVGSPLTPDWRKRARSCLEEPLSLPQDDFPAPPVLDNLADALRRANSNLEFTNNQVQLLTEQKRELELQLKKTKQLLKKAQSEGQKHQESARNPKKTPENCPHCTETNSQLELIKELVFKLIQVINDDQELSEKDSNLLQSIGVEIPVKNPNPDPKQETLVDLTPFLTSLESIKRDHCGVRSEIVDLQKYFTNQIHSINSQFNTFPSICQSFMTSLGSENERLCRLLSIEQERRRLVHDELQTLKGSIRVLARVRPVLTNPNPNPKIGVKVEDGSIIVAAPKKTHRSNQDEVSYKQFSFERVVSGQEPQQTVFDEVTPMLRSFVDGFNSAVCCYGQSGSGKTFTVLGNEKQIGIVQYAFDFIFEYQKEQQKSQEINISVLEIYNEDVFDLLSLPSRKQVYVQAGKNDKVVINGLSTHKVTNSAEGLELVSKAISYRKSASTGLNTQSSRSHCLFIFELPNGTKLLIGDLGGSESLSKSNTDKVGKREGSCINKSLSSLGDVLHAARNESGHIPYRNSKLTFVLSEYIRGSAKLLMILTVSPFSSNLTETLHTLSFGERMSLVRFKKKIKG
ncbi:hypothetical protein P9112_009571 [Eukaryota sp. TZLM1-RC]